MLKRLWDTENKKMVRAAPTAETQAEIGRWNPMQVWTNDDGSKLYVYRSGQYEEISPSGITVETYGPVWKSLEDETVGYYLTNEPTNLFNRDEGDEVAYAFKNGTTTLQSGKVKEGQTPEYTGDTPTKANDEEYSYTFSGWKPEVGPISKKTDFKAQFTATPLPTLLTYSELVALGSAEAILAELNKDDEGYYASLTEEGHIISQDVPGEGYTGSALVESKGDNPPETAVPFAIDDMFFIYFTGETAPVGLELNTWYTQPNV